MSRVTMDLIKKNREAELAQAAEVSESSAQVDAAPAVKTPAKKKPVNRKKASKKRA